MTTTLLPPFPKSTLSRIWWRYGKIPWRGLGLYSPQALLALPAAYASAQFAAHHGVFPMPFNIMLGVAFEWTYIGTLTVAGTMKDNTWYKIVNAMAVISSIVYVTLHAADKYGLLDNLTSPLWLLFFSLIHGVPIASLNYVYGLLVHHHLRAVADAEAAVRYKCEECGEGFRTPQARNGHMKCHSK